MLKTRIITAVVLLFLLLAVLASGSWWAFALLIGVSFALASWECMRLFGERNPVLGAIVWTGIFAWMLYDKTYDQSRLLPVVCVVIWCACFTPILVSGWLPQEGMKKHVLNGLYGVTLFGACLGILVLFAHSALYMLSVMALVWIADIGAYFSGKSFGRHKLAPAISPGKSWEGAIGGALWVLAAGFASLGLPVLDDTFAVQLYHHWGGLGMVGALLLVVAASIIGDLFESRLKRRCGMKDSSNLLPGHGGVLDRLDALIPAVPLAVLFHHWM